jgi:hypothetical protein
MHTVVIEASSLCGADTAYLTLILSCQVRRKNLQNKAASRICLMDGASTTCLSSVIRHIHHKTLNKELSLI